MALPCGPGRTPRNYGGPEETRPTDPRKRPWGRPRAARVTPGARGTGTGMRYVELLRHTDNDGDALTPDGVAAAEAIGRELLSPPYNLFGSTGAARATEMVEILRHSAGQEDVPVTV